MNCDTSIQKAKASSNHTSTNLFPFWKWNRETHISWRQKVKEVSTLVWHPFPPGLIQKKQQVCIWTFFRFLGFFGGTTTTLSYNIQPTLRSPSLLNRNMSLENGTASGNVLLPLCKIELLKRILVSMVVILEDVTYGKFSAQTVITKP